MNEDHNQNKQVWSHLTPPIGGRTSDLWLARQHLELSKKSRAEKDYPEETENIYNEIAGLLDEWEPDVECSTIEDYTWDLADYFSANTDLEIEVWPDTPDGQPQILVNDMIAIELKINPSISEFERWIENCVEFSRSWISWVIILNAPPSKIGTLKQLLIHEGIEQIIVWNFPEN